jgi:HK97 family phage major capsid protein
MADNVDDNYLPAETLTIESSESLKALGAPDEAGKVRVGAYAIRFAKSDEKDLTGDYFTAATDFGPRCGDGVATMFNHGLPLVKGVKALADVAEMTFGPVKTIKDDIGIFVEASLDTANAYEKAIADLCAAGKLKWSSGTSPHIARKSADGQITRWHIAEVSYTPKAAEPRLPAIRPLKSLALELTAEIAAAFGVDTTKAVATAPITAPAIPIITFMPDETLTAEQKARENEKNEMKAVGAHFKCVDVAENFIHLGKSLNELRTHIAENVLKAQPVVTNPTVGMSKREVKSWSFLKAVREWVNGGGAHALTGVEKEASDATASAVKMTPKGFFIPHDIAVSNIAESNDLGSQAIKALIEQAGAIKTLNATTFTAGGALVGTSLMTGSMIELLRNKPLVSQMGARTMSGLVGNVAIPRLNGGAQTFWLSEQGSLTASDQQFGQLGLTPKKLGARTGYTKELMHQTDLSVEAIVRDDLTTILALAKDLAAINGTGGAQPLGILNQPTGLNSVTFGATATRQKMTDFQKELALDNASRGSLAYLTTPSVSGKLMNVQEALNYPKFIWEGNIDQGTIVGRPAYSTNQVPNDRVIYGNWNDLIIGDWAGIDVVIDPYTQAQNGVIVINITLMTDLGVRHTVSFCVSTDSGAQ